MPTNIAIVHTSDFIRARPDGVLDLEASRKLLVDVVSAIRRVGEHNVLIDTRAAAPTRLSRTDLWTLGVAASTQPALAQGRVALLVPLDKQDDAEFFEGVARLEDANVRAFSDFENAVSWLIMVSNPGFECSRRQLILTCRRGPFARFFAWVCWIIPTSPPLLQGKASAKSSRAPALILPTGPESPREG